ATLRNHQSLLLHALAGELGGRGLRFFGSRFAIDDTARHVVAQRAADAAAERTPDERGGVVAGGAVDQFAVEPDAFHLQPTEATVRGGFAVATAGRADRAIVVLPNFFLAVFLRLSDGEQRLNPVERN